MSRLREAVTPCGRGLAARVLVILAAAAIVIALVVGYVQRAVVNSDQFANRATVALRDERVRHVIAVRITDEVLTKQADLIAARPIIESVASDVVGGRAFSELFRAGVRDVHRALVAGDQHTLTLTIADVGTVLGAALDAARPSLADKLRATGRVGLVTRDVGSSGASLARAADRVRLLAALIAVVAVMSVAAALLLSLDRRRTVGRLGVSVVVAAAVLGIALDLGRRLAVGAVDGTEEQAAARAVWEAFLGDLHTAAWVLAGIGAITAAAASSLIRPVGITEPLLRAGRWVTTEPESRPLRALRGAGLVAAGVLLLADRDAVLSLVLTLAGISVIYVGVSALLWLVYRPRAADEPATGERPRERPRRRQVAGIVLAAGLVVAAAGLFVGSGGVTEAAPQPGPCNGHRELCDRALPDVALAATHNAMSVPSEGWYSAEQDAPIAAQLRYGIRGLLLDTHYADRLDNGRLRTDLAGARSSAERDGVSPQAVASARRIRDRLGFAGSGQRGMYVCHSFCELGGTPLASVLSDLRDFLVADPGAVVVVVNQDYVTPADFVKAVDDAGLGELVYRGPTNGRWPTLRQMIDRNQRVLFLAENHAGAAPWYHLAYESILQETPYTFSKARELTDPQNAATTCRPNRGLSTAPLFLVNHWITTDPVPRPSDAEQVNADSPLRHRLDVCRRARGRLPNLVAVNFYRRGELLRAVDRLNGVG